MKCIYSHIKSNWYSNFPPVSIHRPTVAVGAPLSSEATLMPLGRTVTSVGGVLSRHYTRKIKYFSLNN